MNNIIDIGINLIDKQFMNDREEVVERAIQKEVSPMILTGTNVRNSQESYTFAKKYPNILYSTAGIHPHDARYFNQDSISELRRLAQHKEVVAIGECGLDYDRMRSPKEIQEACFVAQLDLARELEMSLFLHERDAHKSFVDIMTRNYKDLIPRSVVHCFTGNEEEVKEYVELGFYIGITGWICDEQRGKKLRKAIKHIPLDKLMVETDAPYLTPKDMKPRPKNWRNEPAFLPHIVRSIAKNIGVSEEEVAYHSTKNAKEFFKL